MKEKRKKKSTTYSKGYWVSNIMTYDPKIVYIHKLLVSVYDFAKKYILNT